MMKENLERIAEDIGLEQQKEEGVLGVLLGPILFGMLVLLFI